MKKPLLYLFLSFLFYSPCSFSQAPAPDTQTEAAIAAQREELQAAARQIFVQIQKIRRNLLDQVVFYAEGRKESDTKFIFTQLMSAKPSQKLLQAAPRFRQGMKLAAENWPTLPALAELREYYLSAFNGFARAAEQEITGYEAGPLWWEINSELDKANQLKDVAFQDAEKAMIKTGEMLVKIGMYKDSPELKTLDNDIAELQKQKYQFLISGREIER